MAFRRTGSSSKRALPGETLLVIHDFEARSPDELSLAKGDRIELIERDDDFGDGWYLGKHIQNGNTGLFPEVYTTTTPRTINITASPIATASKPALGVQSSSSTARSSQHDGAGTSSFKHSVDEIKSDSATPPPLNTTPPSQKTNSLPIAPPGSQAFVAVAPAQRSISMVQQRPDGDSPVMNETLSVIDEHITDMKIPRSKGRTSERRMTNDSASEYSTHIDQRLSYIAGHETDEEERNLHTEKEVRKWTPEQVADLLDEIGVETKHCQIFREQEISGEVLLAMDQSSIFMKEFDLGLVGRRLRTWHKIKAFQEEVKGSKPPSKKPTKSVEDDVSSEEFDPSESGRGTTTGSLLTTAVFNESSSSQGHAAYFPSPQPSPSLQQAQSQRQDTNSTPGSSMLKSGLDSPSRPSAASIRELNHSRRHSAIDFASTVSPATPPPDQPGLPTTPGRNTTTSPHKKTPSLDRNWTMGSPSHLPNGRPLSASNPPSYLRTERNTFDPSSPEAGKGHARGISRDIDRGYSSGGEVDNRKARNVLRKRDTVSANHTRQSSYQADHKRLSSTGIKRHSRFGSVDSIKDTVAAMASPATKMYHGGMGHFRNSSAGEAISKTLPTKDVSSPTVTKLEYEKKPSMKIVTSSTNPNSANGSPKSAVTPSKSFSKPRMGLRAISDAVTGTERAAANSPSSVPSPIKESIGQSSSRTGSTSPSAASQSVERESTDASSKGTTGIQAGLTPTSGTRRKSKKETSAYVRGLQHKSPQEQMKGCDYSGWMKKKSSNFMTTWKPRLFVLRGRRLSYYYTDMDSQEKGLIDISSHRVLPADHDIITSFHATVTGAKSSPISPATARTPTIAAKDAASQPESTLQKTASDSTFIFKLVPPRHGLSRAVNFTKPTIHYFAVDNITQGRLWMAALMKATIDRDETKPITTTYQQKTISLAKAKAMRHRPPALMNPEERAANIEEGPKSDETGLGLDLNDKGEALEPKRTGSLGDTSVPREEDASL
ncbi:hypothetical protein ACLMJK_008432 [Lecanora helva]